jgi:hypothetical protein
MYADAGSAPAASTGPAIKVRAPMSPREAAEDELAIRTWEGEGGRCLPIDG